MANELMIDDDDKVFEKKPKPIGWFFAGLVTIASATFALSYYLPLRSAHNQLVSEHDTLAKKSAELDHALKTDRAHLASANARKKSLERYLASGAQVETESKTSFELASATVENQLKAFTKAKLVTLSINPEGLELKFANKLLYRGRTSALSPQAHGPLCKSVTHLAAEKGWAVKPTTMGDPTDTKHWETATERAANLAKLLETRCKISRNRIIVSTRGASDDEAETEIAAFTTLLLGPVSKKPFLASAAPKPDEPLKPGVPTEK